MIKPSLLVLSLFLAAAAPEDTPEPGVREAIAAATTEPRFLSPWVSDLPASATVLAHEFLGHRRGAGTAEPHGPHLRLLRWPRPRRGSRSK
jgi:hypothetical protein